MKYTKEQLIHAISLARLGKTEGEILSTICRPEIGDDDIMTETDFYKWLVQRKLSGVSNDKFSEVILAYMGGNEPFKERGDMLAHKYVFNQFWHNNRD